MSNIKNKTNPFLLGRVLVMFWSGAVTSNSATFPPQFFETLKTLLPPSSTFFHLINPLLRSSKYLLLGRDYSYTGFGHGDFFVLLPLLISVSYLMKGEHEKRSNNNKEKSSNKQTLHAGHGSTLFSFSVCTNI